MSDLLRSKYTWPTVLFFFVVVVSLKMEVLPIIIVRVIIHNVSHYDHDHHQPSSYHCLCHHHDYNQCNQQLSFHSHPSHGQRCHYHITKKKSSFLYPLIFLHFISSTQPLFLFHYDHHAHISCTRLPGRKTLS